VLAATSALGLAGCSDPGANPAPATTETVVETETVQPEDTAEGQEGTDAAGSGSDGQCGINPEDPRIQEAIANVPAAFTEAASANQDVAWSTNVTDTSFDPCADLSYAQLSIEGATGSSPMQVMLFHRGEYIGTTSDCAPGFQVVRQVSDDSIIVTYRWPKPGEPNAGEKDEREVQYTWVDDDTGVQMQGQIPMEAINEQICHTWPPVQ